MQERVLKRRHLIYYLRVFDAEAARLLGHVVDITTQGLMLVTEDPIELGVVFHLRMVLSEKIGRTNETSFHARSMWCKRDVNPDFYVAGFEFQDMAPDGTNVIERLISQAGFAD